MKKLHTKYKIRDTRYKHSRSARKGFTLIEMLVTISIIALLTTMVLAYSHAGQSISNLRREAEQLVSNLRRAESLSMLSFGPGGKYREWGIRINKKEGNRYSYSLVYYKSRNNSPIPYSTVALRSGMGFNEASIGKVFLFIPPEPTPAYIPSSADGNINNKQDIQSEDQVIVLKLINNVSAPYYKVIITPTGMIYKKMISS